MPQENSPYQKCVRFIDANNATAPIIRTFDSAATNMYWNTERKVRNEKKPKDSMGNRIHLQLNVTTIVSTISRAQNIGLISALRRIGTRGQTLIFPIENPKRSLSLRRLNFTSRKFGEGNPMKDSFVWNTWSWSPINTWVMSFASF